jgi:hypothetical protein
MWKTAGSASCRRVPRQAVVGVRALAVVTLASMAVATGCTSAPPIATAVATPSTVAPVTQVATPSASVAPTPEPATAAVTATATVAAASPSEAASPRPIVFTSQMRGYSLTLPAGWRSQRPDDAMDAFIGPEPPLSRLYVIQQPATEVGDTLPALLAFDPAIGDICPPADPADAKMTRLGSEPALFVVVDCGHYLRYRTVAVHEGDGYIVLLDATDDPRHRTMFIEMYNEIIASLAFDD